MEQERKRQEEEAEALGKFELVWGKILGWPWWPGRIIDIPSGNNKEYKVEFIADPSQYSSTYA